MSNQGALDPFEPGEQRVEPGGADARGAPVEEDQLAGGALEQVVVADVLVHEAHLVLGSSRAPAAPSSVAQS